MSCKFVELTVGITSHINKVHGRGGKDLEVVRVISPHDLGHKECISVLTVPSLGIRLLYAVKYQHLRKKHSRYSSLRCYTWISHLQEFDLAKC